MIHNILILHFYFIIVAFFLNPRFKYKRGVGIDPNLLQVVHKVFTKLDPTSEGLSQFGNEVNY